MPLHRVESLSAESDKEGATKGESTDRRKAEDMRASTSLSVTAVAVDGVIDRLDPGDDENDEVTDDEIEGDIDVSAAVNDSSTCWSRCL